MATSGDEAAQNPVHAGSPANHLPNEGAALPDVAGGQQQHVANMPDVVLKSNKSDDQIDTKKYGCSHYERRCAYVVSVASHFLVVVALRLALLHLVFLLLRAVLLLLLPALSLLLVHILVHLFKNF